MDEGEWHVSLTPQRPALQLAVLALVWRLYTVGGAKAYGGYGGGGMRLQQQAVLQACAHRGCREDVVAEALRVLGAMQLPCPRGGLAPEDWPLVPLGHGELVLALPQLMMLLQRPLSNRCAAGATWLIFCYAANSEAEANCELGAKLLQVLAMAAAFRTPRVSGGKCLKTGLESSWQLQPRMDPRLCRIHRQQMHEAAPLALI